MLNGLGILANESVSSVSTEVLDDEILARIKLQQEIDQAGVESAESALATMHMKVNASKIAVKSLESLVEMEPTDAMRVGLDHNLALLGLSAEAIFVAVNDTDLTKKYISHANEGIAEILSGIGKGIKLLLTRVLALLGSNRAAVSAKVQELKIINKKSKLGNVTWKESGDNETATIKVNDTEVTLTTPMINVSVAEDIAKKKIKITDLDNIKSMNILKDAGDLLYDDSFDDLLISLAEEEYFLWGEINEYDESDIKSRMKKLKKFKDLAKKASLSILKAMGKHSDVYAHSKDGVISFKKQKAVKISHNEVSVDDALKMVDVYYKANGHFSGSVDGVKNSIHIMTKAYGGIDISNPKVKAMLIEEIAYDDKIKDIVLEYVAEYDKVMKEVSAIVGKQTKLLENLSRYIKHANNISYKNMISIIEAKISVGKQAAKKLK